MSNRVAWFVGGHHLGVGALPEIMGILNCTPDSFFDGGMYPSLQERVDWALQMVQEGATIIDVGGESTRPGAEMISMQQELDRIMPVVEVLAPLQANYGFLLSVDTAKSSVAQSALKAGVPIVNDVSLLSDPDMASVILQHSASVVLNHSQGTPQYMQNNPQYHDCFSEVKSSLLGACKKLTSLGLPSHQVCLDPGIGFGKRLEDNYTLIREAHRFVQLGFPVLYGVSRKSYIGKTQGLEGSDRLIPSVVSAVLLARQGVGILRVHDVRATKEALLMSVVL